MIKKILIAIIAIAGIIIVYLAIAGQKLHTISTTIDISAPPDKVWSVLMDINSWQEWSPIIQASSGDAAIGNTLNITMIVKSQNEQGPHYLPIITEMNPPMHFRWQANLMADFMMINRKEFTLEATSTGTRLIHSESFTGLLAPLFKSQMDKGVPPMLDAMNQALKTLVESTE